MDHIAIEAAYAKCGWNAKFFKETGVSNKDGKGTFFTDEAKAHNEWGGGIVRSNKNVKRTVKGRKIKIQQHPVKQKANVFKNFLEIALLRLSKFVNEVVATRRIPKPRTSSPLPPSVVMKMDIEGSEVEVVPDLVLEGSFTHINRVMIEWHEGLASSMNRLEATKKARGMVERLESLTKEGKNEEAFKIIAMDDETYFASSFPLPRC